MKRIALMMLVLSLALAGSACASKKQPGPGGKDMPTPEEQARDMSLEIRSETGLSDAMMREVHHVILEFCEKWDAYLDEHRPKPGERPDGDRENTEREHKRLVREALDKLHPLLRPEDLDVVRDVLEEHGKPPEHGGPGEGPGGGGPGGGPGGPPSRP